jgi:hypothetical protein
VSVIAPSTEGRAPKSVSEVVRPGCRSVSLVVWVHFEILALRCDARNTASQTWCCRRLRVCAGAVQRPATS